MAQAARESLHWAGCSYPINEEVVSFSFITTGEKGEVKKKKGAHGSLAHENSCLVKASLNKTLT